VEEVDIVWRGRNYGWNVYEAFEHSPISIERKGGISHPRFAYRRKYGNSVTGGCVYRGDRQSSFYGVYLCGDYTSKTNLWVDQENGILKTVHQIGTIPQGLVSFGADETATFTWLALKA